MVSYEFIDITDNYTYRTISVNIVGMRIDGTIVDRRIDVFCCIAAAKVVLSCPDLGLSVELSNAYDLTARNLKALSFNICRGLPYREKYDAAVISYALAGVVCDMYLAE